MKKALKIIWNIVFYAAVILAVGSVLLFSMNSNPNKSVFGYRFYNVLSGSMTPTIYKGDMVFVKMTAPQDVRVGDIVTYAAASDSSGQTVVTHRVTAIQKAKGKQPVFTTKGDANPTPDQPVQASQIVGVAVGKLRFLGGILTFIKEHFLVVLIFTAAVLLLIAGLRLIFGRQSQPQS
ncbi:MULTISPECIES: signal peptidase I [Caproicibacterium]|uniref:Signal peptidase I n=1 Tax=Caproicibacterium argilliputei TaxID=3030016 RepID=A0AA97DDN2_9FIRM|nr:signal peptidase I [Caproicibacterium argilliputei]WOC33516.1 signal peptidase I [Caproicibacterium argilliputei]